MTSPANRWIGRGTHLRNQIARISSSARLRALIAANCIAALIIVVRAAGLLQPLELAIYDALRVAWAGNQLSNRVILVGATEDDIARWHWPLRDGELAELLDRLAGWKPRAIGVDLYRDRPEPPGGDQLAAVLAGHREIVWVFKLGGENDRGVLAPEPLRNTDRAVLADILVDPGGVVRRGLLYADDGVENHAAMGVKLALLYLAPEEIRLRPESGDRLRLGKALISRLSALQGPYVRLDDRGYQILLDYHGGPDPFRRVSIADVMDRDAVASLVRDSIVIIGSAAESVRELFMTPFNNEVTGLGIPPITGITMHAYLADQLIRGALDGEPSLGALTHRAEMIWTWGWAIAGTLLAIAVRRTIPALAATFAGLAVLVAIVYEAFGMAFLLPALPAGLAWVGAAGLSNRVLTFELWWRQRYIRAEGRRVRWVPPPSEMPEGAIFISYAREDLAAVSALKNSLEAAGLSVWFDFDRIAAGDSFDNKIHDNIQRCSLFLPVLSHNTEARTEGFFRREWHYALDRDMGIAPDVPFIIPVAVDDTDRFTTLPSRFRELHITLLPQGQATAAFVNRLKQIRQHGTAQRPSTT
jgi:CHASE2 domain-containing sensor protein